MLRFEFQLNISAQDYLQYYKGSIRQVLARSSTGSSIQFPASLLTQFVSTSGVHGRFVLTCDDNFKGSKISRIQPS
jgi:hypothetical protein